ncbi:MAG: hypothetical protein AMXMBFR84_35690 [Candidatus Hydrogenedentota bacterium]
MNVVILGVEFPADNRPVVRFTAKDDKGNNVAKSELTDVRFILAYLTGTADGGPSRYMSYMTRLDSGATQATYDSAALNGVTQNSDGSFSYRCNTAVTVAGGNLTHQVGGQFRRQYAATGVEYKANAAISFRPDGQAVTEIRDVVATESCNKCHTRLSLHGDIRREVQLCILCHSPQSTDGQSGNSVDMAEMVHKIHQGADLPSVIGGTPYQIIGFGGAVHDYSEVVFPQDIRNCAVCHTTSTKAGSADYHLENPSIRGCGSCHDRTWFGLPADMPTGYTLHSIPNVNNSQCKTCHQESFLSIADSHLTEVQEFGPGLNIEITDLIVIPGAQAADPSRVQIEFTATDKTNTPIATLNSTTMNSIAANIAWPATDYETNLRETVFSSTGSPTGTLTNLGGGLYRYLFSATVPTNTGITYAIGMEARRNYSVPLDGGGTTTLRQGIADPSVLYFAIDGTTTKAAPEARRQPVDPQACNACHNEIRFHGDQRTGVEYCVFCHNPNGTDDSRRPDGNNPPVTINFKDMIHKIHSGEELDQGYTVWGFSSAVDFSHVVFPGLRQQCTMCHAEGTFGVPTPEGTLSTLVTQANPSAVISEVLPASAACTSCHDDFASVLHAALNSDYTNDAESCQVCHGEGKEFDVEKVHALAP